MDIQPEVETLLREVLDTEAEALDMVWELMADLGDDEIIVIYWV